MRTWMNLALAVVMVFGILFASAAAAADESPAEIRVQVDGKMIEFPDAKPYIDPTNNRTMVPVRFVSEALGAEVTWDPVKRKVRMEREGKVAALYVGSKKVDVHNRTFYMDATPVIHDGRTYVPLRFVSEAFNQDVKWDEKERLVTITPLPELPERTDSKLHKRNPAAEAAMVSFVNSIEVKNGYVEAVMPKTPDGYQLKIDYYDESDGLWGNRKFDVIELQDRYKAGEKFKIQVHGQGGFFAMSVFRGEVGVGGVSVIVPSLEAKWSIEREI
ncbi:copper amine oxidase N-terminal domain-containing protein [Brevibacillus humidisoli]|uniref:copper amine oxidase N-terminal domain-containing protein n=1 Tax=Brevibacillus humidisoli TaxID=2895522 RepID=UPI001E4BD706|nr:copper amine oxidase N-terminal domain-containing protein [Brevibacillus humidisoli]UFJ40224.1 copper amine oxidase N-terminal domain-containing protein [Brevibacillus humidisoli]